MLWALTPALQIYYDDTFNQGFYFFLFYHRLEISFFLHLSAGTSPSLPLIRKQHSLWAADAA